MTDLADGYVLALPRDEAKTFFGHREDDARLDYLRELLAQTEPERMSCDGNWQNLHDALASANVDDSALEQCLLGGRPMHQGDDHHVCLVRPDIVAVVAQQTAGLDASQFNELGKYIERLAAVYRAAAEAAGAVVFVARKPQA